MSYNMKMNRYNSTSSTFEGLYPQTVTNNVIRSSTETVLENDLVSYDSHIISKFKHINHATSTGSHRELAVNLPDDTLVDGYPLLVTMNTSLECAPTITFNGGDAKYIVNGAGETINGGQIAGSKILIIWDQTDDRWILMSNDAYSDLTKVILPVETQYVYEAPADDTDLITIPKYNSNTDKLVVNYGQTILRRDIDYKNEPYTTSEIRLIGFKLPKGDQISFTIVSYITTAQRGHFKYDLESFDYAVTITADATKVVNLPSEASGAHSVEVNYSQTILRNGIDYTYSEDDMSIELLNFSLNKGDILDFTITKFVQTTDTSIPTVWGTTGNYRYNVNVLYSSYTATEDGVAVMPVPNFNFRQDSVTVIRNNQLYVRDIDYRIDEIGQVVLLKTTLSKGDSIYFTILEGAMVDVPNFNTAIAYGNDGKDLLVNLAADSVVDCYCLVVKLKYDLVASPTIKFIDGDAISIYDHNDNKLNVTMVAGSFLWVTFNSNKNRWYAINATNVAVGVAAPVISHTKVFTGESNFIGRLEHLSNEVTYTENAIELPAEITENNLEITSFFVTPMEPPVSVNGDIQCYGDIWTRIDDDKLYVGNTGTSTSKFKWTIITN